MTTMTLTSKTVLLCLLCVSILCLHTEAKSVDTQPKLQLLKLLRNNMREAKTSLRLAMTLEREMWRVARHMEDSQQLYQRNIRNIPQMEEQEQQGSRIRQPFSPWAGR